MTELSAPRSTWPSRVAALVAEFGEVVTVDADSVVVQVGSTRASIRALELAAGLEVLTVTQLVALDLPNTDALRDDVETCDAQLSFGALRRSDPEGVTTDVLQYYTFPAGSLDDMPLLTVLHMVLSAGADAAQQLSG
ncbi:hypothetical protein VX037_07870 [Gordonia sp. Z-3]|jgi:LmbE family N-acetylglucosaminyl deacetylase|uniref:Uncharacterized protein n=1 Tax=Gordonia aquimaris TaxID=2984863 RepID=A0A9X3I6B3_9ACTN|nr:MULTISPECIES: hypothetical protein [Gordonia]MAQ82343.1 hypothetical protein [Maritimibacter sp.]MAU84266.1 hypothetical protein [Gordonia sp. (in: high G+C Gram-positive bacteria)]MCX2965895.1 hypothetical protein [Gordonia aquimaris]MED5800943.1 hypothetical protein [Gordonia sp. Z-3]